MRGVTQNETLLNRERRLARRLYRDMAVVGLDFSTFDAVERPLVLNDGGVPPAY